MNNHYAVLEVSMQASQQEIKAAYRRLARKYHPDINPDRSNASELFQQIRRAYEILSTTSTRQLYDRELLRQSDTASMFDSSLSPDKLLKQSQDLYSYTKSLDKRVLNSDALTSYVLSLLHPDHIQILLRNNDADLNQKLTANIMQACVRLVSYRLYAQVVNALLPLQLSESSLMYRRLQEELALRKQIERQNNIVPYAAVGLVLLFVLLMVLVLRL